MDEDNSNKDSCQDTVKDKVSGTSDVADGSSDQPKEETKAFHEEQLVNMVVVDDDDEGKQEISQSQNDQIDVKIEPQETNKEKNEDLNQPSGDIKAKHSSVMSDTFVLQLDNADALDSYLDNTWEEKVTPKVEKTMKVEESKTEPKSSESEKNSDSLILTADEELEPEIADKNGKVHNEIEKDANHEPSGKTSKEKEQESRNEAAKVEQKETAHEKPKKKADVKAQSSTSKVLWVSHITKNVKASELKQYLTKVGKVTTAKIVTDGKNCYGYVVMENSSDANKCFKTLNNTLFDGCKISLSFTRPPTPVNKEDPKSSETKPPSTDTNDSKDDKSLKLKKRPRSRSSSKISKRQSPSDPLTTKYERTRSLSRKSPSKERYDRRYLHEKQERERLQRKLLEERRRNREEMIRQMQREEKHRELEFKLEQERRKLQLERELFEKERRELTRLDLERRKIERERLEVLEQRSKLQEELQKSRMKRKGEEYTLSSIEKPEPNKTYDKHRESPRRDDNYCRKSGMKHVFGASKDDRKNMADSKCSKEAINHRLLKHKEGSKKNYEKTTPPPPKLGNFDHSSKNNRKHDYPEKPYNRKAERGEGRKIEVIDRKYYEKMGSDTKHDRVYRKEDVKYGSRYRDEGCDGREPSQRNQWHSTSTYSNPWKAVPSGLPSSSAPRYQEPNYTSQYEGMTRAPPFYYHPTTHPSEEYTSRYDHCSQGAGRKYN